MSLTILALIMTVLMGGVIAYWGDLTGRKYGKRRATMFGLRPKHTAILITSFTGTIISALTTGVLFLVVPPVREVILEGEEALRKAPILRHDNIRLSTLLAEEQKSLREIEATLPVKEKRLASVEARLAKAETDLQAARRDVAVARTAERAAVEQARREQARQRVLKAQNTRMARQNSELAEQNVKLTRDLDARSTKLADVEKQLTDASGRNRDLSTQNAGLESKITTLEGRRADLERENDARRRVIDASRNELEILQGQLHDAVTANARVTGVFGNLMGMYQAMRARKIVYRTSEEVARRVIPAHATPDDVRKGIGSLLQQASLAALARGAGLGNRARAVEIVDKQFYAPSDAGAATPVAVSEDDRKEALVSRLAWSPEPVCISAVAVANSVAGEPASVDIQPWPNHLIYRKGQQLATRRIDNADPADQVFNDIVEFLRALGRTALDRGMVPTIDPDTGEPQVGSLNAAEIAGLVDQVRRTGPHVNVTAVASSDVTSADRLKLDFHVNQAL